MPANRQPHRQAVPRRMALNIITKNGTERNYTLLTAKENVAVLFKCTTSAVFPRAAVIDDLSCNGAIFAQLVKN
jgi:hypothetical protein